VNDLLSRKSTWSDDDVGRFTRLVRQDHVYEQAEAAAKAAAARAEDEVERAFSTLMRAILNRYHEEQVWSDKIRSASTYGSLAVLGLNVVVFVLATMFVEPWKRRRLAGTFERKVDEMDARNTEAITGGIGAIQDRLDRQERTLQQYAVAFTALQAASVQPTLQPPAPAESPNTTEPEPAPAETTLPPPSTPSLMSWRDWPAFVTQDNTRQAILAASSVAFVGGTVAGWLVRELRR
jgi:sensitive to high expression protein 9